MSLSGWHKGPCWVEITAPVLDCSYEFHPSPKLPLVLLPQIAKHSCQYSVMMFFSFSTFVKCPTFRSVHRGKGEKVGRRVRFFVLSSLLPPFQPPVEGVSVAASSSLFCPLLLRRRLKCFRRGREGSNSSPFSFLFGENCCIFAFEENDVAPPPLPPLPPPPLPEAAAAAEVLKLVQRKGGKEGKSKKGER